MVLIPPTKPPSAGRTLGNHEARIRVLERLRRNAGAGALVGQVYNDAGIIAGTGFTAEWSDFDGSSPGLNLITVFFDVPYTDPPTVVLTGNNNNPADVEGEYVVTQKTVTTDYFVVYGLELDGTPNIGGFNFAVYPTEPSP